MKPVGVAKMNLALVICGKQKKEKGEILSIWQAIIFAKNPLFEISLHPKIKN